VHTLGCLSRIHGWKLAVKVQCDESPDKPATYKPATNMLSRMQNQGTIMKSQMLSLSARKSLARKSARMLERALGVSLVLVGSLNAQQNVELKASGGADTASTIPSNQANSNQAPLTLTLADALKKARANSPQFQAAATALGVAHQDRVQSRAGLLPSVNYNMQYLYTQGQSLPNCTVSRTINCATGTPIFIANNGVHEYIAQGNVHQALSLQTLAEYRRSGAAEAVARAKLEIATRGLVVTVVQGYYGFLGAQRKYATAQRAAAEAERFSHISQQLENGGEVAHSDAIKAQIQLQQQQRDLRDAELEMSKSRLELAVLLFPNFNENYSIVDDIGPAAPLPSFDEVSASGSKNNPDLRVALETLKQTQQDVVVAWNGLMPTITLDYYYGIDAAHFATKTNGISNLGNSASATLQLPLWNWGANYSKIKQANLQKKQAQVELSFAQRSLMANLRSFYLEAQTLRSELDSLSQSAQLAAESLRLTNLRYQSGESTVLEVVDAQNTLNSASKAYDDGQVRYKVAVANLQTITGTF
jgi:outer membrane protein